MHIAEKILNVNLVQNYCNFSVIPHGRILKFLCNRKAGFLKFLCFIVKKFSNFLCFAIFFYRFYGKIKFFWVKLLTCLLVCCLEFFMVTIWFLPNDRRFCFWSCSLGLSFSCFHRVMGDGPVWYLDSYPKMI